MSVDEMTQASRSRRRKYGRALRDEVPLAAHAEFTPTDRDPIAILERQAATRWSDLIPVRYGRMMVSPFTFYRGAAAVMAADLSGTPSPDIRTQLCGDAHLANFGAYASPERRLVFDINDFDETLPGPFEWDVKRLAASLIIAARDNGFDRSAGRFATEAAVRSYRDAILEFADQPYVEVWYANLNVDDAWKTFRQELKADKSGNRSKEFTSFGSAVAKARTRTGMQAIGKLTSVVHGKRRIRPDPPVVVPLEDLVSTDVDGVREMLKAQVAEYRLSLHSDRRALLDHYRLTDIAHKVVGVGSVGTRCWIVLFQGSSKDDALLLQAKEANESVLAPYLGASEYAHQGERVVNGQRLMQAASDVFLGWATGTAGVIADSQGSRSHVDYYLRQLRDWKMSAEIEGMSPVTLNVYAELCGWTLARAHARSGDRLAIAGYLGHSDRFVQAVADFAEAYAVQNERDHAALHAAVEDGRLVATPGV